MSALLESPGQRTARYLRGAARALAPRLASGIVVLLGAATLTFLAQALLPGDRATLLLNQRTGIAVERSAEELAPINAQFGFTDPLIVQFWRFLGDLASGHLGVSYQLHKPVSEVIAEQFAPTMILTLTALAAAWAINIVWITATAGRGRALSGVGSALETFSAGLPHYWLGVILLVVFALQLGWFPVVSGTGLHGLVLPVLTLALPLAGFMGQASRTEYEKTLDQPFVISARLRGMGDTSVRLRHVLRHALLPGITLSGWALGALFSGAVIVETIFARPGLGKVLVTAVNSRDIPVVAGIVVVVALLYVVANFLVDIAYTLVDPRLRTT